MDTLLTCRLSHGSEEECLATALELTLNKPTKFDQIIDILSSIKLTSFSTDGYAEDANDYLNKSALPVSGAGHNKDASILRIVAPYVNRRTKSDNTLLHLSVSFHDTQSADLFLKAGADVNAENKYKETPLHCSCVEGHKDIVEILLKAGANVGAEDMFNQTPLHYSARQGHKDIVEILLKAGANVDAEDMFNQTPLHFSASSGHKDIVETLLAAGANVYAKNKDDKTPLHYSLMYNYDDVTGVLLRAGVSAANTDIKGRSVLDLLNKSQRVKFGYKPVGTLLRLRNWMSSVTNKNKYVQRSTSTRIETEHTETVSVTFTESDSQDIRYGERSSNNGQAGIPRDSSTLLTSGTSLSESAVISSGHGPSCAQSTSAEPQYLDDSDHQELNNLSQKYLDYMAKFPQEISEGCETSCSNNVKSALMAGRVVINATVHITQNKKIKNVYNLGHVTNITNAEAVAPNGQVVFNKIRNVKKTEEEDDEDEEDSSSEDVTNNNV